MRVFLVLLIITFWINNPARRRCYLGLPIALLVNILVFEYFFLVYWVICELMQNTE